MKTLLLALTITGSCVWSRATASSLSAFAGGGFGASRKKAPKQQKKKKKGGFAEAALLSNNKPKPAENDNVVQFDKWGLPPPSIEDIFPLMPPDTEMIPVEIDREYSLTEINEALKNHIPLDLAKRFDKNGVEQRSLASDDERELMKLRLLHCSPPVLAIDNFFTAEECLETQRVAMPSERGDPNEQFAPVQIESKTFSPLAQSKRTSTSWFCYYRSVPTLLAKARDVLGIPLEQMEEPQIVRYQPGQTFTWHYDEVPSQQLANGGQRLATLLVYLNTVQHGGGTIFRDLHDGDQQPLTVRPQQGSALLFFPALADGTPDDRTLHQGEVAGDEKSIIQMWIHERSYRAAVPPNNRQQDAVAAVEEVSRRLGYCY